MRDPPNAKERAENWSLSVGKRHPARSAAWAGLKGVLRRHVLVSERGER